MMDSLKALVVQWIEQRTPNARIEVRFLARAPKLTLREIILRETDPPPLRSGGTLGRGGTPPTPPFRYALALTAAAIQISLREIRRRKFRKEKWCRVCPARPCAHDINFAPSQLHIWDYTSILRHGA